MGVAEGVLVKQKRRLVMQVLVFERFRGYPVAFSFLILMKYLWEAITYHQFSYIFQIFLCAPAKPVLFHFVFLSSY